MRLLLRMHGMKMADLTGNSVELSIELGFVEEVHPNLLLSLYFPSKVGGKPSWLKPTELVDGEDLKCKDCNKVLTFLLQVYSPLSEPKTCFHRTTFVFCCRNGKCYKKNSDAPFVAFRCQLPRANDFYEYNGIADDLSTDDLRVKIQELETKSDAKCDLCGCKGSKKCSECKAICYCSKEHQTVDWKYGHKNLCAELKNKSGEKTEFYIILMETVSGETGFSFVG